MKKNNLIWGIILIIAGIILLLNQLSLLEGPSFLFIVAAGFIAAYFIGKKTLGFLIPGLIILSIATFSSIETSIGELSGFYFLIMLGIAFVLIFLIHTMYIDTKSWGEKNWPLFPGVGLICVGVLGRLYQNNNIQNYLNYAVPVVLVAVGLAIIFTGRGS